MVAMTTAGYTGSKSPNRVDWMVWAITELFPFVIKQAKRDAGSFTSGPPVINVGYAGMKKRPQGSSGPIVNRGYSSMKGSR